LAADRPSSPKITPAPESLRAVSHKLRRRVLIRTLACVAVLDAALLVTYAVLPISEARGWAPIAMFAVVIIVFGVVVSWQLHAILTSRFPGVRAAAGLAFAIPVYLVLCSLAYLAIAAGDPRGFNEPLDRTDAMYFTMTVFATVGFGDITADTAAARIAVTIQMVMNMLVIGLVARLLIATARTRMAQANPGYPMAVDPAEVDPVGVDTESGSRGSALDPGADG
jgi:hypothetical protein